MLEDGATLLTVDSAVCGYIVTRLGLSDAPSAELSSSALRSFMLGRVDGKSSTKSLSELLALASSLMLGCAQTFLTTERERGPSSQVELDTDREDL